MAVHGRARSPTGPSARSASNAEMGAAHPNSANYMEGPNSVISSPVSNNTMDADSCNTPFLLVDEIFTLGDFVSPLEIFRRDNETDMKSLAEQPIITTETNIVNMDQRQTSPSCDNILGDHETCPINIEDLLKGCTVLPEAGAFRQTTSPNPVEPPLGDDLYNSILYELLELPGFGEEPFILDTSDNQATVEHTTTSPLAGVQNSAAISNPESQPQLIEIPTALVFSNSDVPAISSALEPSKICSSVDNPETSRRTLMKRNLQTVGTSLSQGQPEQKQRRKNCEPVGITPDEVKRHRNKEASRKSRQKRKLRDCEMQGEAEKLEHQNKLLREQIAELESLKLQIENEVKKAFPAARR